MRSAALLFCLAACAAARPREATAYTDGDRALLVPMLQEVLRFPTVAGNAQAQADQKRWLEAQAGKLGLQFFDEGPIARLVLPGPSPDAPRLGLMVHGDVQPVEDRGWSHPPFAGEVENGVVYGRGAADDKGPLVQALVALHAFAHGGHARTHTIELLVGSDEESGSKDVATWLASHKPPDYTLVLDLDFPVMVGEKAWNGLAVTAQRRTHRALEGEFTVASLEAGQGGSIVPDRAALRLFWSGVRFQAPQPRWAALRAAIAERKLPEGTSLELKEDGQYLDIVAHGKAAHSGVNIEGGRNAIVALAVAVEGLLPRGQADDLLAFARFAGRDIHGSSLGLPAPDELWGGLTVNVATIKPPGDLFGGTKAEGALQLLVNIRSTPALSGAALEAKMRDAVAQFNARTGAELEFSGYWKDEPLVLDPDGKLARRLLAAYDRAMGVHARPGVSGGGSYAKRIPNAIGFGMWFRDAPYPGHDADEKNPVEKLHAGVRVLLEALDDLATGERLVDPLKP